MLDRPEGIIKTMPKYWNYKAFEDEIFGINSGASPWIWSLSGKPKYEILYFYLLHDGLIKFRANIMGYPIKNATILCATGEYVHGKIWAEIGPPIIKPPRDIRMKGFQGFRYTGKLF